MSKAAKQEVALIDQNASKLNQLMGFVTKSKPSIPWLKINGSDEGDGSTAPKGTFVIDDGDAIRYAKEVTFRTFSVGYQFQLFDKDNKDKNDRSVIAPTLSAEFPSISGRLKCGKLTKKQFDQLGDSASKEQTYFQTKTKCKMIMFGLVSGSFTDLDTKVESEVKDELVIWTVPGSNMFEMGDVIKGIDKERRAIPSTPIKMSLKKEINGKVTYYSPVPLPTDEVVKLVESDLVLMDKIKTFIKDTNSYVLDKYNTVSRVKAEDKNFADVGKTIEGKATVVPSNLPDINDEIPF